MCNLLPSFYCLDYQYHAKYMNPFIRYISLLFFSVILSLAEAQIDTIRDYSQADKKARSVSRQQAQSVDTLVKVLTSGFDNDHDKFRSIFTWTINHLQFDEAAYKNNNRRLNKNIGDILRRRKAVCFGYAQLIQHLSQKAGIECHVVSGYASTNPLKRRRLSNINHAWNVVLLEGQWHVLDATWQKTKSIKLTQNQQAERNLKDYFLMPPELFIRDHLPADPMWQLLPCRITMHNFKADIPYENIPKTDSLCEEINVSINKWKQLNLWERKIESARKSYTFNPIPENADELAATYLDYEATLSIKADSLKLINDMEALIPIQIKMVELCDCAAKSGRLFDNQKENCAYNKMNAAIALYRNNEDENADIQQQVINYLEAAQAELSALPENILIGQAIATCSHYLEVVKSKF